MLSNYNWMMGPSKKPWMCWYQSCTESGSMVLVPCSDDARKRAPGRYCPVHAFDKWRPRKRVSLATSFKLRAWYDLPRLFPSPRKIRLPSKIGD